MGERERENEREREREKRNLAGLNRGPFLCPLVIFPVFLCDLGRGNSGVWLRETVLAAVDHEALHDSAACCRPFKLPPKAIPPALPWPLLNGLPNQIPTCYFSDLLPYYLGQ
jgi:hypothetical protein